MKRLTISLCLCVFVVPSFSAAKASDETVEMVELFVKAPTDRLPADKIDEFLAVDPASLPPKLRKGYAAKRVELYTLQQLADGKKKGIFRNPQPDCSPAGGVDTQEDPAILGIVGYARITDQEEKYLEGKTHCTEIQLICEFTLKVVIRKKGKMKERLYFLHVKDPLMAYVAEFRAGMKGGNTNFFGTVRPGCPTR